MITAPFSGVWGWPWHGLCKGGQIDSYAKTFTQPPNGNAWLIDMGLPSISLTTDEAAEAAANDYKWRNYAKISGGLVYDTALPADSFIHVDEDNVCWLVVLSYSYPSTNTIRITSSIKRFGVFGFGEFSAITKTSDVVCTEIDISSAYAKLQDVWTNGEKSLVSVYKESGSGSSYQTDIYAVVEMTISGSGGSTGSGLSISAIEVIAKSNLTTSTRWSYGSSVNPNCSGYQWIAGPFYDMYLPIEQYWENTWAREAFYNSSGVAKVLRLKWYKSISAPYCISGTLGGLSAVNACYYSGVYYDSYHVDIIVATDYVEGYYLLVSNTEIDKIETYSTVPQHQHYTICNNQTFDAPMLINDQISTTDWYGSLSINYDSVINAFDDTKPNGMVTNWRKYSVASGGTYEMTGGEYIGLQTIDAKSAAFYHPNSGTKEFGTVSTPLGTKTTTLTPTGNLYFAWQRKTGDFEFDTEPICYV